jgi:predicted nucleotidyltransferase
MASLRTDLWRLIARDVEKWKYPPLYASAFGSAARHDGTSESDIDLLLVRPSTRSEISEKQRNNPVPAGIEFGVTALTSRVLLESQLDRWEKSVERLRGRVQLWSGSPLQVVNICSTVWAEHRHNMTEIYNNIKSDEVRLYDDLSATPYRFPEERNDS